jgi:hypothetical protein
MVKAGKSEVEVKTELERRSSNNSDGGSCISYAHYFCLVLLHAVTSDSFHAAMPLTLVISSTVAAFVHFTHLSLVLVVLALCSTIWCRHLCTLTLVVVVDTSSVFDVAVLVDALGSDVYRRSQRSGAASLCKFDVVCALWQ